MAWTQRPVVAAGSLQTVGWAILLTMTTFVVNNIVTIAPRSLTHPWDRDGRPTTRATPRTERHAPRGRAGAPQRREAGRARCARRPSGLFPAPRAGLRLPGLHPDAGEHRHPSGAVFGADRHRR